MERQDNLGGNKSVLLVLSGQKVSETHGIQKEDAFTILAEPSEAENLLHILENVLPETPDIDPTEGMAYITVFAGSLSEVPDDLSPVVDSITDTQVIETPAATLVVLPPDEGSEVVSRNADLMAEWE